MNAQKVTDYIIAQNEWQQAILDQLREAVHEADVDIEEDIKWGSPAFSHNGLVAWMFCAKDWVHFSFPQGVLLDQDHGLFVEEQETNKKGIRTIKIYKGEVVPTHIITRLVNQAVANNKAGRKVHFNNPKQDIVLPDDMKAELKKRNLENEYQGRPYYQRKGYIQWISSAKKDDTRRKRIQRMISELNRGEYMPPKNK